MDRTKAKAIFDKVFKLSPARMTEVTIRRQSRILSRFSRSDVTQNFAEDDLDIAIRVVKDGRMGRAVTNRLNSSSLTTCCENALKLARNAAVDENILPLPGVQKYLTTNAYFESTAGSTPGKNVELIKQIVENEQDRSISYTGQVETETQSLAVANSQGLFAHTKTTGATLNLVAINENGNTGFSTVNSPDMEKIDPVLTAKRATSQLREPFKTRRISPGEYAVVLDPLAVLSLLSLLIIDYVSQISHFSGSAVINNEGIVAGRIGERVFGENFTLDDDVFHPLMQGVPFDGEGMPTMPVILIFQGVLAQLVHSRSSALRMSEEPTGHSLALPNPYGAIPQNLVMQGGESSVDEMIKSTKRGVYVSRFWYTRLVDPGQLTVTGLTRDGAFLIEDGRITGRLDDLRFNESLYNVFSRIDALGKAERTWDIESRQLMVVPPLRIDGFRFTGSTKD